MKNTESLDFELTGFVLPTPKVRGTFDNWRKATGKLILKQIKELSQFTKDKRQAANEPQQDIDSERTLSFKVDGDQQTFNIMLSQYIERLQSMNQPIEIEKNGKPYLNRDFVGTFEGSQFILTPIKTRQTYSQSELDAINLTELKRMFPNVDKGLKKPEFIDAVLGLQTA